MVKDQFGVLVAAVAQGGHKNIGRPQPPLDRVEQLSGTAKIDLQLFTGGALHPDKGFRFSRSEPLHKAPHRRIAALIAVVFPQSLPDGGQFHPLLQQLLDHGLVGGQA